MNREQVQDLYRRRAPRYDVTSHLYALSGYRIGAYRRRGIELLQLRPGDTVVEVGCGTGANFDALERAVGPAGSIVGVDLTAAMLDEARARASTRGWANVTLVESDATRYEFPERVDAILSTYALTLVPGYDEVIVHAAAALAPGGRIAIVDVKAPEGWPEGVLRAVVPFVRPFGVELKLRDRHPWESLAKHLKLIAMEERYLGTTYIAVGEKPPAGASPN